MRGDLAAYRFGANPSPTLRRAGLFFQDLTFGRFRIAGPLLIRRGLAFGAMDMKRVVLVCIAALALCSACLTKEDIDCWYDDWCKDFAPTNISPATVSR